MSNSPPLDEAPAETVHPSGIPKHWIVLGLLVVAHAVFGAYFKPVAWTLRVMALGSAFSQPILLATWAAFARQRFHHRLLWSLLICTYLSFADDLGAQRTFLGGGELILNNLALFVVTLVILLPIRRLSRWQIARLDSDQTLSVYLDHHFGINHLLFLTAIVALACGLVRSLFIITYIDGPYFPYNGVGGLIVIVGLLLVVVFPSYSVPWITLADHRKGYRTICLAVLLAILIELADLYVMTKLQYLPRHFDLGLVGWNMDDGFLWVLRGHVMVQIWMQLGAVLSTIVTTLVFRFCGFRMVREPKVQA